MPPADDPPPLTPGLASLPVLELLDVVADATPAVVEEAIDAWVAARTPDEVVGDVQAAASRPAGQEPATSDRLATVLGRVGGDEATAALRRAAAGGGPGCGAAWVELRRLGRVPDHELFAQPPAVVAEALGAAVRRGASALDEPGTEAPVDLPAGLRAAAGPAISWLAAAGDEAAQQAVVRRLAQVHSPAATAVLRAFAEVHPVRAVARAARRGL